MKSKNCHSSKFIAISYSHVSGVRAILITKDNNPKWDPSRIEDVTEDQLLPLYEPLPNDDKLPI